MVVSEELGSKEVDKGRNEWRNKWKVEEEMEEKKGKPTEGCMGTEMQGSWGEIWADLGTWKGVPPHSAVSGMIYISTAGSVGRPQYCR